MMPPAKQQMALTQELAAQAAQPVDDLGPSPGAVYMTDEDYEIAIREMLAQAPAGDVWLFAYGSLLWKPACETAESRRAVVRGWHRSFCFRVARFRGTRDRPGLMMALDRGGQCLGMIFRLPADQVQASLDLLFRREMMVKPAVNVPRWLTAHTSDGPVRVIGFVVNRQSSHYTGRLAPDEAADIVSTAAGHWGSCAEYLRETVSHLEELGIRDRNLWRLQALVAGRIKAATSPLGSGTIPPVP
jgi:glutathione-specific gamma-glutamylcyclotransferase